MSFKVHCRNHYTGEVLRFEFDERPTLDIIRQSISLYTGFQSVLIVLGTEAGFIHEEEQFDIQEGEEYNLVYMLPGNASLIKLAFQNMATNFIHTSYFDITSQISVVKRWLMKVSGNPHGELELYSGTVLLSNDNENARNFEFGNPLRYRITVAGVKFRNKMKGGEVETVPTNLFETLNDYATHLAGDPGRITFELRNTELEKTTKMEDLLTESDPIRVFVKLDMLFPDRSNVSVKMDLYATIYELSEHIRCYFMASVQDMKTTDNKILARDANISSLKEFELGVVLENSHGQLLTFARDKHHFKLWIAEGENVDVALSKIATLPWMKGIEKLDIDIANGKTVMPLRSTFPNSRTVYRVKNKTSTATFVLPNGDRHNLEIALGSLCSDIKRALITKVDPSLRMSDVALYSQNGKIRKGAKMRNELNVQVFYFVTEKQKLSIEVETDTRTYRMNVSPTCRVQDIKAKVADKEGNIDDLMITDIKYNGRILHNDNFLFEILYSKEKSKFHLGY